MPYIKPGHHHYEQVAPLTQNVLSRQIRRALHSDSILISKLLLPPAGVVQSGRGSNLLRVGAGVHCWYVSYRHSRRWAMKRLLGLLTCWQWHRVGVVPAYRVHDLDACAPTDKRSAAARGCLHASPR